MRCSPPAAATSGMAAMTVASASSKPSGTGLPSALVTAVVYMWIPTFRISSTDLRPFEVIRAVWCSGSAFYQNPR